MAAEIESHYADVLVGMKPGDRHFEFLVEKYRELKAETLIDYLDFDKFPKTERQVRSEIARQAENYIKVGLNEHPLVNLSKSKFKDSLIKLAEPQPKNSEGRFNIPAAVLGQVPPRDVYAAVGAGYHIDGLDLYDWPDDPQGYSTPQRLYLSWTDSGVANLYRSVDEVRASLRADAKGTARGATDADGGGLYSAHLRILEHHWPDFPGTSVERGSAPDLRLFGGRPGVSGGWVGSADPRWGSALCGRD